LAAGAAGKETFQTAMPNVPVTREPAKLRAFEGDLGME
jgi:hypothetical protein